MLEVRSKSGKFCFAMDFLDEERVLGFVELHAFGLRRLSKGEFVLPLNFQLNEWLEQDLKND